MTRAFVGLGSNLGDRARHLREAVAALQPVSVSDVYETEPVGGPEQGPFLNLVAQIEWSGEPHALLERCRAIETAAARIRTEHWGPRTLDVDVLWIEGVHIESSDLTVPHPRMWQRRFVLAPLAELAPDLVDDDAIARSDGVVERLGPLRSLV